MESKIGRFSFFPEHVKQVLDDLLRDFQLSCYTGCVQAKRGIIKPENTFECFNIPFLDLFEYEQIHNNLVSTDN